VSPLTPPPDTLPATREALHRLAVYAVAPWRRARTGRIGLRATPGGFGTPPVGDHGDRVRVHAGGLVVESGGAAVIHPFTTLADAARRLGVTPDGEGMGHDLPPPGDPDAPLAVDPRAVDWLGDWFAFGEVVLRVMVADAAPGDAPSEIQLWPEHFDLATELGAEPLRMGFGVSPGDAGHDLPYVYAQPWTAPDPSDPFWDAPHRRYRSLSVADLVAEADPVAAALEFIRTSRAHVRPTPGGAR
jgi:hypothetical protein